ncbi:MAG: hypothetical protein KOO63_14275 [Bacteroidales bacterium]|nr:hypothetical protein [Candidatus Latescibacterota bacterium]
MTKSVVLVSLVIIVNACLWGFTILMVAHTLKGTGAYQEIQNILGAGAGMSTVIIGGGLGGVVQALRVKKQDPDAG